MAYTVTMIKEKKEMEYPDSPSGFVTLYNYKEPFMPFKYEGDGYGYEGVLLFDGTSDKIQCHLCGNWLHAMGNHLQKEHNMKANDYKELTGLRKTTALVSETLRAKMIANGLDKRLQTLRAGGKKTEEQKQKIRETNLKNSFKRESQNEKGTCPQQLIDRIQRKATELGRCPTLKDITYEAVLRKVFGSFTEACRAAGLEPQKPGQTRSNPRWWITDEELIKFVRDFWIKNSRFPKHKECPTAQFGKKYFNKRKEINKKVLWGEGKYQNLGERIIYTKTEMIEILRNFQKNNNRLPSISDCKRGLLPHASRYYYHFGNFKNALELI